MLVRDFVAFFANSAVSVVSRMSRHSFGTAHVFPEHIGVRESRDRPLEGLLSLPAILHMADGSLEAFLKTLSQAPSIFTLLLYNIYPAIYYLN